MGYFDVRILSFINMKIKHFFLTVIACSTLILGHCQEDLRVYGGLGANNDTNHRLNMDFSLFFLKKESRFNAGSNLGLQYSRFDNPNLGTDSHVFYHLGLQAIYAISNKVNVRVDLGSRRPTSKKNYNFLDDMENTLPDSELGGHIYLMPNITYNFDDALGVFIFYNKAFENRLDMNTLGIGISIKL